MMLMFLQIGQINFNKNVLKNVTPKSVSILHDEKSEKDSVMIEFGDGEIKTKKLV